MAISVAGCERSFSKMKLIVTYLRSSTTESRLTNLATLSIERETVEQVDFSKLIEPCLCSADSHIFTIVSHVMKDDWQHLAYSNIHVLDKLTLSVELSCK